MTFCNEGKRVSLPNESFPSNFSLKTVKFSQDKFELVVKWLINTISGCRIEKFSLLSFLFSIFMPSFFPFRFLPVSPLPFSHTFLYTHILSKEKRKKRRFFVYINPIANIHHTLLQARMLKKVYSEKLEQRVYQRKLRDRLGMQRKSCISKDKGMTLFRASSHS